MSSFAASAEGSNAKENETKKKWAAETFINNHSIASEHPVGSLDPLSPQGHAALSILQTDPDFTTPTPLYFPVLINRVIKDARYVYEERRLHSDGYRFVVAIDVLPSESEQLVEHNQDRRLYLDNGTVVIDVYSGDPSLVHQNAVFALTESMERYKVGQSVGPGYPNSLTLGTAGTVGHILPNGDVLVPDYTVLTYPTRTPDNPSVVIEVGYSSPLNVLLAKMRDYLADHTTKVACLLLKISYPYDALAPQNFYAVALLYVKSPNGITLHDAKCFGSLPFPPARVLSLARVLNVGANVIGGYGPSPASTGWTVTVPGPYIVAADTANFLALPTLPHGADWTLDLDRMNWWIQDGFARMAAEQRFVGVANPQANIQNLW